MAFFFFNSNLEVIATVGGIGSIDSKKVGNATGCVNPDALVLMVHDGGIYKLLGN